MKISLFFKPFILKVCFYTCLLIFITSQPKLANAGFFSDLITKVVGTDSHIAEATPLKEPVIHNSQNMPLLESSINPDFKNIKEERPVVSASNPSLLSNNESLGVDYDLEKFASTEKISTYTVKKGDSLDGISKSLKIAKSTIIAANADLKKKDLLKVGQTLVIIGLKDKSAIAKADTKTDTTKETVVKKDTPKEEKAKVIAKAETDTKDTKPTPKANVKKDTKDDAPVEKSPAPVIKELPPVVSPEPVLPTPEVKVDIKLPETPEVKVETPESSPTPPIGGGYIWPLPDGVGRISQGLHADRAVDISAPKGTPIYAIQSGTVLLSHGTGYNGGYGLYVVIDFDNGAQAIFAHMSKVTADQGQTVKRGDLIGYVGSTGHSTGAHLHVGMHGGSPNPYETLPKNSTGLEND